MSDRRGFALVAVMGGLLLLAAVAVALLYVATLDGLAARYAQRSVVERAQLEAALQLAAHELDLTAPPLPTTFGPWPAHGVPATVDASGSVDAAGTEAVRFEARLTGAARAQAPAVMVVSPPPELELLWRP